jgi:hypothetical protein
LHISFGYSVEPPSSIVEQVYAREGAALPNDANNAVLANVGPSATAFDHGDAFGGQEDCVVDVDGSPRPLS